MPSGGDGNRMTEAGFQTGDFKKGKECKPSDSIDKGKRHDSIEI